MSTTRSQVKPIALLTSAAFASTLNRARLESGDALGPADGSSIEEPLAVEEWIPDYEAGPHWSRLSDDERRQRLTEALSLLPKRQRQALMLQIVSSFELSEIATVLNVSETQVNEWVDDARRILRAKLEALNES